MRTSPQIPRNSGGSDTIRRMISRNEIPARRFGRRLIRVDLNALDLSGTPVAR